MCIRDSCVTDRVKDAAERLRDFIDVLKGDSYFKDIVETLCTELHSTLPHVIVYGKSCSYIFCSLSGDIDSEKTNGAVRKEEGMPVSVTE